MTLLNHGGSDISVGQNIGFASSSSLILFMLPERGCNEANRKDDHSGCPEEFANCHTAVGSKSIRAIVTQKLQGVAGSSLENPL